MWLAGGGGGGVRGGLKKLWGASKEIMNSNISLMAIRNMSRERAVNVRKINPKVPIQEAYAISNSLYDLFKHHGPLSVPNTWLRAQEAGVIGLNSKTHMKLLLKWMRGKKMLKLICNHVGSSKKFLHTILPDDDPQQQQQHTHVSSSAADANAPTMTKNKKQGFKRRSK